MGNGATGSPGPAAPRLAGWESSTERERVIPRPPRAAGPRAWVLRKKPVHVATGRVQV